ncbi:hypothetical protein APTSU1_001465700 [Apodemus speciosus]|uniref:Uncharacterized protein n=1 Tax=Apodemus speciosus TaxID=105296 RepID=A0ABQ0FJI7_APOSI
MFRSCCQKVRVCKHPRLEAVSHSQAFSQMFAATGSSHASFGQPGLRIGAEDAEKSLGCIKSLEELTARFCWQLLM